MKKRGSLIKVVNILITICIEFSLYSDKINFWLEKYSKILKYFLIVCENVRDSTLSLPQQTNIISNILYPYYYFYTMLEKYKENDHINSLLMNQIEDIVMFNIYLLDQMNNKVGGFQNYNELKANMFTNLYVSNQIPISNLFSYEIFTNFLFSTNNERIFSFSLYDNSKVINYYI